MKAEGKVDHSIQNRAEQFVKNAHYFSLGHVVTEQPHPKTVNLSHLVHDNLPGAIAALKEVDVDALCIFRQQLPRLMPMQRAVQETIKQGGRVFLCGCGATGRLVLFLEYLWRTIVGNDKVIAFMAGGDVALVQALEGFEDYPQYGARHLLQLGFAQNDLLISCTEGGETPFVIGATEQAESISRHKPFFLYCNPDEALQSVQRSKQVIENTGIHKINLTVGPMALAGSTRMQASTILQLAVGMALFIPGERLSEELDRFLALFHEQDLTFLKRFIVNESAVYLNHDYIHYLVKDYGMTTFTDTTERAPTFSLPAFDNLQNHRQKQSLSYISLVDAPDAHAAWKNLLGREPRSLNWQTINEKTVDDYLMSFDFSKNAFKRRTQLLPDSQHHGFSIYKHGRAIGWSLDDVGREIDVSTLHPLFEHTLLKILLNMHSTLVMGRLSRYRYNLMTHVSASNGKLIDRAARYVSWLLRKEKNQSVPYSRIIYEIFFQKTRLQEDEPIVLKVYRSLSGR